MKRIIIGITLITLVITIIVLLILAAVSISTLTGENGILTKASDAKRDSQKEAAREKIQIAVLASYGTNGKIDVNQLNQNLAKIEGLTYNGKTIDSENVITEKALQEDVKVTLDGYEVTIFGNGTVTVGNENIGENTPNPPGELSEIEELKNEIKGNIAKFLQKAESVGQTSMEAIGIGTDRNVINLDLWNYFKTNDGKGISLGLTETSWDEPAYLGRYINGRIEGEVPQYIYFLKTEEMLPVTRAGSVFKTFVENSNSLDYNKYLEYNGNKENTELIYAPKLPNTLKTFSSYNFGTFFRCINLQEVNIPESVTDLGYYTFYYCTSLTKIIIPDSVTTIGYAAFQRCTSITEIVIPSSVVYMNANVFKDWTSSQTIYVPFKEGQKPSGWSDDWNAGCSATIVYEN